MTPLNRPRTAEPTETRQDIDSLLWDLATTLRDMRTRIRDWRADKRAGLTPTEGSLDRAEARLLAALALVEAFKDDRNPLLDRPKGKNMTRVQIPAYTDRWMMGDRYGVIIKVTQGKTSKDCFGEIAHVKLDKSGKTMRFILSDCTEV